MRLPSFAAALATLAGALLLAAPAHAGTATTTNACKYSYDSFFRDSGVVLTGAGTVVPTAARPSPTQVVPGDHVKLSGATVHLNFPDSLARFGYAAGLLVSGDNTITAKVWVAVKGSGTKEGTQFVGPLDVTATTHIFSDPSDDDRFLGATPFAYTDPTLPDTTWTATGGDVTFAQADAGALPALPTGPSGAPRTPIGSTVLQAFLSGSANVVMDCAPGVTTGVNPGDGAGPDYAPGVAGPFDTVAGPQNVTCLDDPGRQVAGAAANLPAGITRELDPASVALTAPGAATTYTAGSPYTLAGAKLRAVLGADTVATLGRFADGGTPIVTPDKVYPLRVWVTIAAAGTTEGTQTVAATGTYALHPAVTPVTGSSAWAPSDIVVDLPATTWHPTGAGPIVFSGAPPGTMSPIDVVDPAFGSPGGGPVSTTFTASPYGSVVLRGDTERNPVSFDCVPGAITVADSGVAWSNAGRSGSAGRYAIDTPASLPGFLSVTTAPATGGGTTTGGGGTPTTPTPTTTAPTVVVPAPKPTPAAPTVTPGKVGSKSLKADRRGRVKLLVSCAGQAVACRGTVRVVTAKKLKVGSRNATLIVTAAKAYTAKAGKPVTLTLTLGKDARAALKKLKRLGVVVTLKPAKGAAVTQRLTLT